MKKRFEYRHIVGFEDTNVMGNVYFANYISWQGKCRELFIKEKAPELLSEVEEGVLSLITLHCSCNFLAELKAFDEVIIGMSLDTVQQNRIRMLFDYMKIAEEEEPKLVATGVHEIGCFLRRSNGFEVIPVPQPLLKALQEYKK